MSLVELLWCLFAKSDRLLESGLAYVVVQHLDPTQKALLAELLQRVTKLPVREAENRMRIEPDCVYVIPPNTELSVVDGELNLENPTEPRGFMMRTYCRTSDGADVLRILPHVQLFPRLGSLRWRFRVHEQILDSLNAEGIPIQQSEVKIRHVVAANRRRFLRCLHQQGLSARQIDMSPWAEKSLRSC